MLYTLRFFSSSKYSLFHKANFLVPVLFTLYIQGVLKLKKNNSGAKGLTGAKQDESVRLGSCGRLKHNNTPSVCPSVIQDSAKVT